MSFALKILLEINGWWEKRKERNVLFYGTELQVASVCICFHIVFTIIKTLMFVLPVLLNNRNFKATDTLRSLLGCR